MVRVVGRVDPDHPGLNLRSNLVRALDILRENTGTETVSGIVGTLDSLLCRLEAANNNERTEDLLPRDSHIVLDVRKDSWLDEIALLAEALTTTNETSSLILAGLDISKDLVELHLGDLRSLVRIRLKWITDDGNLLGLLTEGLDELLVNALLDIDTRGRAADLAHVAHDTSVRPLDGLIEVAVLEDDVGRLSSGLKGTILVIKIESPL